MNEFSNLNFLSYECMSCHVYPRQRLVHDYELDYHYYGNSVQTLDGKNYPVTRGTMVMRRPGQVSYADGDYYCRMITFDISGEVVKKYGRQHRLRTTPLQEVRETPLLDNIPSVFVPNHEEDLTRLFKIIEIFSRKFDGGEAKMIEKLNETLLELLLILCSDAIHERAKLPKPLDNAVFETCRLIDRECGKELRVEELARMAYMSADHLARLFKQEIGVSPSEYIFGARMKRAKFLLESSDYSIDNIAAGCGFSNTAYFIKRFREQNGVTPKQYRCKIFKGDTVSYFSGSNANFDT